MSKILVESIIPCSAGSHGLGHTAQVIAVKDAGVMKSDRLSRKKMAKQRWRRVLEALDILYVLVNKLALLERVGIFTSRRPST